MGRAYYGFTSSAVYSVGSVVTVSRAGEELSATILQYDAANRIYWVRFAGLSQPVQVLDTQIVSAVPTEMGRDG
ncbi:hypothetical protein BDV93DRAFT_524187 [Ceratobasidium sp. AG-I]|nr:hypothetical protein BDV93DRAFT_524187 [Ceratobasidium sp. AG-I]